MNGRHSSLCVTPYQLEHTHELEDGTWRSASVSLMAVVQPGKYNSTRDAKRSIVRSRVVHSCTPEFCE
jgi:hypothetical protein